MQLAIIHVKMAISKSEFVLVPGVIHEVNAILSLKSGQYSKSVEK